MLSSSILNPINDLSMRVFPWGRKDHHSPQSDPDTPSPDTNPADPAHPADPTSNPGHALPSTAGFPPPATIHSPVDHSADAPDDHTHHAGPRDPHNPHDPHAGPREPHDDADAPHDHDPHDDADAPADPDPADDGSTHSLSLPIEFQYLQDLIRFRIAEVLYPGVSRREPPMPDPATWELPIAEFIKTYDAKNKPFTKDEVRLLLLALVHHVQPDLFDHSIASVLKGDTEFPRIGGFRGKNFRGFIPTGETAVFLLAGDDWRHGLTLQKLFWTDHPFAVKKILWLGEVEPGEPAISGKLILSQDYIDMLAHNQVVAPHHSVQFPAQLVTTTRNRSELVVNEKVNTEFDHLLEWFHLRETVENEWKGRKKGYRCLFYGPSGTGKTFMTCLLGKEAGKEVYRVDLSLIISKYIGETEKNLELVFARAEHKDWILFFDEADALFGKRTNIRDAHDKYANQEVSYLLQRIEQYDGLVILATNMKNNIDDAFRRRFEVELQFTMPNSAQRRQIWKNSFPTEAIFRREKADTPPGNATPGTETPAPQKPKPNYYHYAKRHDEATQEAETDTVINPDTIINPDLVTNPGPAVLPPDIPELVKGYRLSGASIENVVHYSIIRAVNKRKSTDTQMVIYWEDVLTGINRELRKNGIPLK
jgi:hypothetical protein